MINKIKMVLNNLAPFIIKGIAWFAFIVMLLSGVKLQEKKVSEKEITIKSEAELDNFLNNANNRETSFNKNNEEMFFNLKPEVSSQEYITQNITSSSKMSASIEIDKDLKKANLNSRINEYIKNLYGCVALRHSEGEGIGYTQGYSTMEAFFINSFKEDQLAAILDFRIHYLNNNTLATNTGIGYRYATENKDVFGINFFYDSRKIHNAPTFHELSLSLEWLGFLDFRLSGYLPVGKKKHFSHKCRKDYPGNYWITNKEYTKSYTSLFFDIGYRIKQLENFSLYGSLGQYYLELDNCNRGYGGRTKLLFEFWNCLNVQLEATFDTLFKIRGRAIIGLHFDFGGGKKRKNSTSLFKYCEHNEIIPLGKANIYEWNW